MKRWAIAAAAALAGAAAAQSGPSGLSNYPMLPTAEPFTETVFGTVIDDPYRWMDGERRLPEVQAWLRAASAHTRGQLAALPGYAALKAELLAASEDDAYVLQPRPAGGRLFYIARPRGAEQSILMVREPGVARDRVLLDPAAGGDATRAIGRFTPSPDGRLVAVTLSTGGGEVGEIAIVDAATGRALPDRLQPIWGDDEPQWVDSATLYYDRLTGTSGTATSKNITAYVHRLGTPAGDDPALVGGLARGNNWPVSEDEAGGLMTAPGSAWTLAEVSSAREEVRFAVAPTAAVTAGHPSWTPIAGYAAKVSALGVAGDTLYFLTSANLPDGELRALDLRHPALTASRRRLGGAGLVLKELAVGADGVYVTALRPHGENGIWFVPFAGGAPRAVVMPGGLSAVDLHATGSDVTVDLQSEVQTDTHYRLAGGRLQPLDLASPPLPALAGVARTVQEWAVSADGTRVPLSLILPRRSFTGPRPTILYAYGAYGTVMSPAFSPARLIWAERGGIAATCHVRGGGELGSAWHEAGREANKVRGHEDLAACARRLIALGLATPRTLGVTGSSAGGMLVPPTALAHPELFAAVVSSVGMVNPIRLETEENGPLQYAEFGDPRTAAGFRALASADSTLLLPRAAGGPDFMFTVGLNDHRVPPSNSAKLAAMMRARWGDRHLALIRADDAAGHGHGSSRESAISQAADIYAFFLNRFGQPGFVAPPR